MDLTAWLAPARCVASIAVVFAACGGARDQAAQEQLALPECFDPSASAPSFADAPDWELTAEYGLEDDEALVDAWGMAYAPDGGALLWDAGRSTVIRFDSALRPIREFGRRGSGPGEFGYQRASVGNWIASSDSGFVVMDLRAMSLFDYRQGFREYATPGIPVPLPKNLGLFGTRVFYAVDNIDRADGSRVLETWELDRAGDHRMVRTDPMPSLPRSGGRLVRGVFADQAEPLWAMRGRCIFLSDGASDWILRVDIESGRGDTLVLPERPRPERTAADEEQMDRLRRDASRVGINAGSSSIVPTAPMKWVNLTIDPTGAVWVEPWRPFSQLGLPMEVLRLDSRTGAVDSIVVPEFPDVFLRSHAFVSRVFEESLGIHVLRVFRTHSLEEGPGEG